MAQPDRDTAVSVHVSPVADLLPSGNVSAKGGGPVPLTAIQLKEEHEKAAAVAARFTTIQVSGWKDSEPIPTTKPMKPTIPKTPFLDVNSPEAFPSLGGPAVKTVAAPTWGIKMPYGQAALEGVNGVSVRLAPGSTFRATGQIRNEMTSILELQEHEKIPKAQLKGKTIADIGKQVGKETGTRIEMSTTSAGVTVIIVKGVPTNVAFARRELMRELCPRRTIMIPIPTFVRPYVIGKAGEMIKRLQQETQTKLNIPRMAEGEVPVHEDDGTRIEITIEGDAEGIEIVRRKIEAIVAEKTARTTIRISDIPGKFYPFIAGPHFKNIQSLQKHKDINITVPEYFYTESKELSHPSGPIIIKGEKAAANEAKVAIEDLVQNLSKNFTTVESQVPKSKHRLLAGDNGQGIHDLLENTGCSLILPALHKNAHVCFVTGPGDKVGQGLNAVMEIANSYTVFLMNIYKAHPTAPIGGDAHARALVRLWQKTGELNHIEAVTGAQFNLPKNLYEPVQIEITTRSPEVMNKAKAKLKELVESYIPERIDRTTIDPLCHHLIIGRGLKQIYDTFRVQVLIGEHTSYGDEVFLVCEDASIPKEKMKETLEEVKGLLETQARALGDIVTEKLTIGSKFQSVIQDGSTFRALSQGNVCVGFIPLTSSEGEETRTITITIRGPSADVKVTAKKINAWVEENKDADDPGKLYTLTFDYPQQYTAPLIGSKGANVNKLRDELGVDIKLKEGKGEIRGVQISTEVARRRINEQIRQLEDNTTIHLKVAPEHHRAIIGIQGRFVRRLEDKYEVKITFPKLNKEEEVMNGVSIDAVRTMYNARQLAPNEIMIKGRKKGCAETKSEIEELVKYEVENGHRATVKISVKSKRELFTEGKREWKRILEESGAKIDVPSEGDASPDALLEIKIKGTRGAVESAKTDLETLINDLDQLTMEILTIDKKYHRALIGPKGATLREIVEKAGGPKVPTAQTPMVHFPRAESSDDVVTIKGNRTVVENIISTINGILEEKQKEVSEVVDVPTSKHAMLIGRGRAFQQKLEASFKVSIDIPRRDSGTGVTITGLPSDVSAARERIILLTKDAEEKQEEVSEIFDVPTSKHAMLIGRGGIFRQELEASFRVSIDIPKRDSGTRVTITGLPSDVSAARERIILLTKDAEGETVCVPKHLHHSVSDGGLFYKKLRHEFQVTVDHSNQPLPPKPRVPQKPNNSPTPLITDSDYDEVMAHTWDVVQNPEILNSLEGQGEEDTFPWVLRSTANTDSVTKAKEALLKQLALARAQTHVGFLTLSDQSKYRYVIGPSGSEVNRIRAQTGCRIMVPKNGEGDSIIIWGSTSGLDEARDIILELVQGGNYGSKEGAWGGHRG